MPSINYWRRTGGPTSERGADSASVLKGIQDSRGRLMVLMTTTRISPIPGSGKASPREYFDIFSPRGYGSASTSSSTDDA